VILVDTSAWVDYLRDRRTVAAKALIALIEQGGELTTTEPVIMELLAGGDTLARADALERLVNGLPFLGHRSWISEPQPGCTPQPVVKVAQYAALSNALSLRGDSAGCPLLRKDADYEVISNISPLRIHRNR
jgi:hypothetical protein